MKNKNRSMTIKIINIILCLLIVSFGCFSILYLKKDKEPEINIKIVELNNQSSEDTMFKNELPKKQLKEHLIKEKPEKKVEIDPDLEYSIKLFETEVNTKVKSIFKYPFNYVEGSSCKIKYNLIKNKYSFDSCNADALFKRELQISLDKIIPIKNHTYNNINLNKEKYLILNLNMD